jgi:hypothetical protein
MIKYWLIAWMSIISSLITYTLLRENSYRIEKEKIEYMKELSQTQNKLELELNIRYIDSLKQEINKQ